MLKALARLTRIEHAFMLSLAAVIGEVIAGLDVLSSLPLVLLTIIPPFFIEIASFAVNDYFDLESDRLNKRKDRPLVSGEIKPAVALYVSVIATVVGVSASWFINLECFLIALVFALLAWLYNYKLKDLPLLGNLYIGLTMAIPFVYGNLAVAPQVNGAVWVLGAIAFVTGVGREIMITTRDIKGDKEGRGSTTLPMVIGVKPAIYISSSLFTLAVCMSALPFMYFGNYVNNLAYVIPILFTDFVLLYVAVGIMRDHGQKFLKKSRKLTLIALGLGLVGFFLGSIVYVGV